MGMGKTLGDHVVCGLVDFEETTCYVASPRALRVFKRLQRVAVQRGTPPRRIVLAAAGQTFKVGWG